MTNQQIHEICEKYNIRHYTINEDDMSINVDETVSLNNNKLEKLPLNFKKVNGHFDCCNNELTSLEGCPKLIMGSFFCNDNKITSIESITQDIRHSIHMGNNKIKNLKGFPEYWDSRGYFVYKGNPIESIINLFSGENLLHKYKYIYWINEYDVIQGDNVIMDRLEEVFIQLDLDIPIINEINGYNII